MLVRPLCLPPPARLRSFWRILLLILCRKPVSAGAGFARSELHRKEVERKPHVRILASVVEKPMIELTVNGAARKLPEATSVAQLLEQLGLAGKRLAVERNGQIVPRGLHVETRLTSGDQIEIVVAVGGG